MKPQMANMSFYARYVSIHLVPFLSRLTALNWCWDTILAFFRGWSSQAFAPNRTISAGLVALGGAADRRRVEIICVAYSLKFCHLHIRITFTIPRNAFQQILRFLKSHSWPNRMERFENLDVLKSIISDATANPWRSSLPFVASHSPQVFPLPPPPLLFVPYLSVRLCVARTMVIRRQIPLFSLEQNPINPA